MFDFNELSRNPILMGQARQYVLGMAHAKAELLQQEIDMAFDVRVGSGLTDRIDKLDAAMLDLSNPEGNWVTTMQELDKEFLFLSEPEYLSNVATRSAALLLCKKNLLDLDQEILDNDLDPKELSYLTKSINEEKLIKYHLTHYENWLGAESEG